MIRKGFSLYLVRSAKYGRTLKLSSFRHKDLVTQVDTSPEVSDYVIGAPSFRFLHHGKPDVASVPVSVVRKDGSRAFLDLVPYGTCARPSTANVTLRAHAKEIGFDYELFDGDSFDKNIIEKKNRQSAQNLLYLAHGSAMSDLQTQCLLSLTAGPLSVTELAQLLGASETKVLVVALRLWLAQKIEVPLTTRYLGADWTLRRLDHAHR